MSYSIQSKDRDMTQAFRRISQDRLGRAIKSCEADTLEARMTAVHDIRKRLKEIRGLLRLVGPDFDGYKQMDRRLRDIGRQLSDLRDIKVRCDTLGQLSNYVALSDDHITLYLNHLAQTRDTAYGNAGDPLSNVAQELNKMLKSSADWHLRHKGRKALFPGLSATYKAAYDTMERARETREPEDFHTWRKHVKYHFFHARLLAPIWPDAMEAQVKAAESLGELLGKHHDLIVLSHEARSAGLNEAAVKTLEAGLKAQIATHEKQAFLDGARLFADTPEALTHRWSVWYRLWRHAK
ncbi:CHAD domain-containing protein [Celeribacter sp. PS-C1]|uniref:CHAD domain-containing protein n=1 Tax=Celeribacter sp. PS-C1 TaxID=2820813 RepID=UPI001C668342|nr:CHAD domain-containing protein [Celeribacter sp. PS-C1]MBW6418669.1 CHAD domain-containing protein [Celeribacter sp. PS-C1]